jgi:hypothetical protein
MLPRKRGNSASENQQNPIIQMMDTKKYIQNVPWRLPLRGNIDWIVTESPCPQAAAHDALLSKP